jgi:hypothetical protein
MANPIATMMRNEKNTGQIGGRSCGGTSFRPGTTPAKSWVRIQLPIFGIEIS